MSRNLEVSRILRHVQEAKVINLDMSFSQLLNSDALGVISASDEPWELICYTWVTVIHRGPISSIDEIYALSGVLQKALEVKEVAGRVQRGG